MAIFKCVGYFYFHVREGICFAGFFLPSFRVVTLRVSIWVFLASRQAHTQETTKLTKGKQHRKNTNGNMQSVTTRRKGKKPQQSRILQAYQHKNILQT
jgi:hypothetical protein